MCSGVMENRSLPSSIYKTYLLGRASGLRLMLPPSIITGFPGGSEVRICLPKQEMQETRVQSLDQEDALGKEIATHSSILAWGTHGQRSLGGPQSIGLKKSDTTEHAHTHTISYYLKCNHNNSAL